jgi:hypothetical protein
MICEKDLIAAVEFTTVTKENYRQAIHQTVIHWQYPRKTIDRPYTRQLYIGSTQGKL